ncbi:hypothetical protein DAPPUDRAFT_112601 [Daphnia pulex]|uniref:Uncharacterized protein n=1 Tax=Daphnia pulex TaxID=6669 RepID=E9HCM1_DAPPU|nr:hypothetical protein DAPPUDRAFT_112601 [Daphnia pulex]|eukprot:EFX70560.1 hypothetical protein DAPPUDRAFT_112601 [Daphnia pulex]
MDANATVLKRTFALVADRKENTVVLLDVEARVRKIPAEVISSSSETVVFQTERRFINNKEQIEFEADSLITLHEADPEDEDPLHIDDLYYDDVSSIDSGSTEPNPDLQLNFPSDEKAVSPFHQDSPTTNAAGKLSRCTLPQFFSEARRSISKTGRNSSTNTTATAVNYTDVSTPRPSN